MQKGHDPSKFQDDNSRSTIRDKLNRETVFQREGERVLFKVVFHSQQQNRDSEGHYCELERRENLLVKDAI